jgi:hypothetical protein
MNRSLTERCQARIAGTLSCCDRVVITGTLPTVCYAEGMTQYLHLNEILIFDYPKFAQELNGRVRECAAALAAQAEVRIEHSGGSGTGGDGGDRRGGRTSALAAMEWQRRMPRSASIASTR